MRHDTDRERRGTSSSLLLLSILRLFPRSFREEHGGEWTTMAQASPLSALLKDTARALPLVWRQEFSNPGHTLKGISVMLDALRNDLRFASRTLWKNPGFSIAAILTLALGIGANATVFSVVDGVLLEPLPYPEHHRLTAISMTNVMEGDLFMPWSVPRLRETAEGSRSFREIAGYTWDDVTLTGMGDPELVYAVSVTNGLMRTLGVAPELGRDIREDESLVGQPLVAVVSHSFWAERLGSDPGVLGRTLELSGRSYEIVGVAPSGFSFPSQAAIWIPGMWSEEEYPRDRHFLRAVGQLGPGIGLEAAQSEVASVVEGLKERDPSWNPDTGVFVQSLSESTVGDVRLELLVLLGAVAMVLLIACANVANLLLARGAIRAGEMAVRSTLGAGRGTLIRQLMTESLVLALLGCGGGLLLSVWGVHGLKALSPRGIPRLDNIGLDGSVVAFTLAISILVALAFGLAPALRLSRFSIAGAIRAGQVGGFLGRGREWARSGLLVGEVGLSLALLLGAGLLLRSFLRINEVDLGFDPAMVQQFNLSLPRTSYDEAGAVEFYRTLEDRLSALPGVVTAGMGSGSPLGRSHTTMSFTLPGEPAPARGEEPVALIRMATPGYLPALGVPLQRGRGIEGSDLTNSPRVLVVSADAAAQLWPAEDPIGQQISFDSSEPDWTVVGVVGDVRSMDVTTESYPEVYIPHTQWPRHTMTVEVLHGGRTAGLDESLRATVRALDPNLAVYWMEPLQRRVDLSTSSERFYLLVVGLAAGLAVVLAAVGLFGVVAFLVSRRTREIGIRIALGARSEGVVGMVLRQSMPPVLLGIALGVSASLAGAKVLSSLLYQVEPWDPPTFILGSLLFLTVALGATLVPAGRAARIAPTEAMRAE